MAYLFDPIQSARSFDRLCSVNLFTPTLFYLFQQESDTSKREESLKTIMTGKYEDMNELERSFYTITIMLAEIEKVAKEKDAYDEKEVLEPGDEGFIDPNLG